MGISEKKMQIVLNNYFEQECDVNTSIREAFEKGFKIGVKKGPSAQPETHDKRTETHACDLISRQAVIDLLKQMRKDGDMVPWEGKDVFARIRKLPSAQPERKTGKWEIYVISMFDGEGCRCSECGLEGVSYWDFCPNCGADMREVSE